MLRQRSSTASVTIAIHSSLALMTKASFVPNSFRGKDKQEKGANTDKKESEAAMAIGSIMKSMPGIDKKKLDMFMKQSPEDQVKMMRQAIQMQKSIGSSNWMAKMPGMGALSNVNVTMMEKMLDSYEKSLLGVKKNEAANSAPSSSYSPKLSPFSDKSGASIHATETVSSTNTAVKNVYNQSSPTHEELQKVNLGPEIEELFAELKSMREKKNYFRDELEKKEKIIESNSRELSNLSNKDADMRRRLATAEQTITILNNEVMELKAATRDYNELEHKHVKLQDKLASFKGITDEISEAKDLHNIITAKDDVIRGLNRKLQRIRRRDPLLQFSSLIDCIRSCALKAVSEIKLKKDNHTTDDTVTNQDPFDSVVNDEFLQLQETYNSFTSTAWEGCSDNVRQVLLTACAQYISVIIGKPYGGFDALVTFKTNCETEINSKVFIDLLTAKSFQVRSFEESAKGHGEDRYVISMTPTSNGPLKEKALYGLGPFGYFLALHTSLGSQSGMGSGQPSFYRDMFAKNINIPDKQVLRTLFTSITSVKPYVSEELARHVSRSRVEVSTSRSSSPGGQAANVGETQITMNLYVDGAHLLTSEAQDSRSAMANREMAETRMYGEKLSLFNRKELANMKFKLAGNEPIVHMTSMNLDAVGAMWSEYCASVVSDLDSNCQYLDAAVVAALIK